jgi:Uma2 family endonuclease
MTVSISRRRFTADDFHKMAACGILAEDDRVELLDGDIVEMTPIGLRHLARVDRLNDVLAHRLHGRAIVRVQGSIRLDLRSEPQPDLILLKHQPDFYERIAATPGDVLLVIEVGDTSVDFDRDVKLPLYAHAGIREVWLVNLPGECLEVYASPEGAIYRDARVLRRGEAIAPTALPDLVLQLDDVLG